MDEEGASREDGWRERDGASVSTATCTDTNRASSHRRGSRGSWPPGIIVSPGLSLSLARLPLACYLDKDTRSSACRVGRRRGNSRTRGTLSSTSTRPRPSPWGHRCVSLCPSPATLRRIFPGVGWAVVHTAPSRVESSRAESRQDETRRRRTLRTWIIVILLSSRPSRGRGRFSSRSIVSPSPTYIPASRKKDVRTEMSEQRYPWKMESARSNARPR